MDEVQLLHNKRSNQMNQNSLNPSPRLKRWTILIVTLLFCLYFMYFFINPADPSVRVLDVSNRFILNGLNQQTPSQFASSAGYSTSSLSPASPAFQSPSTPSIILLWTAAFDSDSWWGATKSSLDCDCVITRNRSLLSQAKVVLFYWRNTNFKDLPKYKFEGQTWIWHHMESPMNTFRRSSLATFSHYIDCWSTYRLDSDFPTPYGTIVPIFESKGQGKWKPKVQFNEKTRNVAWMVSNCAATSGRDEYAKELAQYIDVDIYGACGSLKCPSSKGSYCYQYIEKKYRYYLSFENSICQDYYTEKIINLLNYTVIPIVLGGANYSSVLPNHSYIDALSFKSPRYLALLLKSLAADETRYNSYFEWKSQFQARNNDYRNLFCQICSRLKVLNQGSSLLTKDNHNQPNVLCNRRHKDLVGWWFNEGSCRSWTSVNRFKFWS